MIKEKEVYVKIGSWNHSHYKKLGYDNVKKGNLVLVRVEDLTLSSHTKITAICEICGVEKQLMYKSHILNKENNNLYHNLIVNTEKDIARAELELLVSGDNDKDDGIEIYSTNNGTVQGNKLKGIALSTGKNQIKIRFADNLKHSIKIKAYELQ